LHVLGRAESARGLIMSPKLRHPRAAAAAKARATQKIDKRRPLPGVTPCATGKQAAVGVPAKSQRRHSRKTASVQQDVLPLVFLSFKHGPRWTPIVERLELKLRIISDGAGFQIFCDREMEPGNIWRPDVEDALNVSSHFVVLLCDEYWESRECQIELNQALQRFRDSQFTQPRLWFILGEHMRPELLQLSEGRKTGAVVEKLRQQLKSNVVEKVGDINFLGPFDAGRRLVRLASSSEIELLSDQLADMVSRLAKLIQED
jgi:hypothetical protein